MKLQDSGLSVRQFSEFVSNLKPSSFDEDIENFEEGTVYLNDEQTDYIKPDEVIFENQVHDDGKYQNVQSVYRYLDKYGDNIYLSHTYVRSGSHFTEWYNQEFELNVVTPHKTVIVEYR